jgi:uncharacterized protein GlcG (DUF336 family)
MSINLADAKQIIDTARKHAAALNKPITIAVVDSGGYVVALERMDGARPLQPNIATAKAYTGAIMQRPGLMLKGWQDSQPSFFAQLSTMGLHPILATEGALPIKRGGVLVGGLGVAGGTGPEDQQLCEAVLRELGYELDFDQFNRIRK